MNGFNNNGYHIENLKKLKDKLVENKDSINLDMCSFVEDDSIKPDEVDCGTAGCIVGHAVQWFDMTEHELDFYDYHSFSERLFMDNSDSTRWDFLFDDKWCDDIDEAIARLKYVIENGDEPDDWDFENSFKGGEENE
ncbi:hypothetical protein N9043_00400 [bacterium]|nr:hypothetical protein [bacterium]